MRGRNAVLAAMTAASAMGVLGVPALAGVAKTPPFIEEPGVQSSYRGQYAVFTARVDCGGLPSRAELTVHRTGKQIVKKTKNICSKSKKTTVTFQVSVKDLNRVVGSYRYKVKVGKRLGPNTRWTDSDIGAFRYG